MDKVSYADIGILVVLVLLSLRGLWQGLIRSLASFLGIALGVFFASRFYQEVGLWFSENIYNFKAQEINFLIGFLVLITLIWAICLMIGETISRVVNFTPLAVLDRALGLLFGFAKAFLITSVIVFGITQIGWLKNFSQNLEQDSSLFPAMKKLSIKIMNLDSVKEIKQNLNDMGKILDSHTMEAIEESVKSTLTNPTPQK